MSSTSSTTSPRWPCASRPAASSARTWRRRSTGTSSRSSAGSPAASRRSRGDWPLPKFVRGKLALAGEEGKQARQLLIGFGGGTHRCIGPHFAHLEMKIVLSRLLRHYEMELVDGLPAPVRGFRAKWLATPCRVRYRVRVPARVPATE